MQAHQATCIQAGAVSCRALDQQAIQGVVDHEYWVENLIQKVKSTIKHRSRSDPEVLVVNTTLQKMALAIAKRDQGFRRGAPYVQWFDEFCPEHRCADLPAGNTDTGAANGTQLIGKGSSPPDADRLVQLLQRHRNDYSQQWTAWPQLSIDSTQIFQYDRAQIGASLELLHSDAYQRPKKRKSIYAILDLDKEGLFIAKMQRFLKVQAIPHDSGSPARSAETGCLIEAKRFTVATLYRTSPLPDSDSILGSCFSVLKSEVSKPKYALYAVPVDELQSKAVWANVAADSAACAFGSRYSWLFVNYPNTRA